MAEARFYVYVHRQADTGEVFYVGKGSGRRAWTTQQRPTFWYRVKAKHGLQIEIVAMFWDEAAAFQMERELIAQCRAEGARLTNCTDGGEGPAGVKMTEETRQRRLEARRKREHHPVWSEESRQRMREFRTGKKMAPESIAKTVASRIGRKLSPETVEKIKTTLKGRLTRPPLTKEEVERLRASKIGKPLSDETKAKLSAAKKGKPNPHSPEHRAKRVEAVKRYWAEYRAKKAAE